jgi:hypothetical protein
VPTLNTCPARFAGVCCIIPVQFRDALLGVVPKFASEMRERRISHLGYNNE